MAAAIKLDEATVAKVKAYAAETFDGFSDKSTLYPTGVSRVDIPALPILPVTWNEYDETLWHWVQYRCSVRANWLERIKDRYAPRWLRRRWPVRWRTVWTWRPESVLFGKQGIDLKPCMTLKNPLRCVYLGYNASIDLLCVSVTAVG